jgi:hypothetical protein
VGFYDHMLMYLAPHVANDRLAWIAKAAYLRAERRRFAPGHELDDWLAAESEVIDASPAKVACTDHAAVSVDHRRCRNSRDLHPVYEHDRLQGVGPYRVAKIGAEELCLESRTKCLCVP